MTISLPRFEDLLDGNQRFAGSFTDEEAEASKVPTRELVVLSCMDARVDPWRLLDLGPGQAHILRNAGGRASDDAIRSVAVSSAALGTRRVAVIHHTDCGMKGDDETVRAAVRDRGGEVADEYAFLTFADDEEAVRDDVRTLRTSPLVPGDIEVAGFLYDVTTGQLRAVPAG